MRLFTRTKKDVSALITIAGGFGFREVPNYPARRKKFLYKGRPVTAKISVGEGWRVRPSSKQASLVALQ